VKNRFIIEWRWWWWCWRIEFTFKCFTVTSRCSKTQTFETKKCV